MDLDKGPVPLKDFVEATNLRGPRTLFQEYKAIIDRDIQHPANAFESNPTLNRWKDIRCYDNSRVPLKPDDGYVHANFVNGSNNPRKFICTQGPMENTAEDFWKMVWQQNTVVVVALTKVGGAKCHLYFPPQQAKAFIAGEFKIQTLKVVDEKGSWNRSQMIVSYQGEKRQVGHFLYHDWPDKGNPDSTKFLEFMNQLRRDQDLMTKEAISKGLWSGDPRGPPIVVHCSAGVGRTGTLVAMDILMDQMQSTRALKNGPFLDIPGTVLKIRNQRHTAVQKPEQYIFLYLGAVEYALREKLIDVNAVDVSAYLTVVNKSAREAPPAIDK